MPKKQIQALARQAIIMEIGGFRPPDDPSISWFGKVNLSLPGESWPMSDHKPMHALCQINLTELPFRPPHLHDLAMISIFIGPHSLPTDEPNGVNWCLRTYGDLTLLKPLEQVNTGAHIKRLPMRPRMIAKDFPCLDDVTSLGIEVDDEDDYVERFVNTEGLKLGGWPTLIQSQISWDSDATDPEYVFQIDSTEKGNWQWGSGGVGYFARSDGEADKNTWSCAWQCF